VKVGGGLVYVTGPMGAGKTLFAVRKIIGALLGAQYVVTNVELMPGWADRVARHYWWYRTRSKRNEIARRLEGFYIFETDLAVAIRYRAPGRGEARALFIWDEGHNDLNNRDWRKDGRELILKWATQLRKLGFVGYLLSQHADNTDAALRRVCNAQVRLQNQREQHRVFGMRVTPWPLFLAFWYPAHLGGGSSRVESYRVERYFLGWHRKLYDTHGLYHGLDAEDSDVQPIHLPIGGLRASGSAPQGLPAAQVSHG